ncbi:VCBS domain-containing protein, partial [Vibrio caribbeanicus]|uniref:VCBS domain-containing protein n=1 Tax=Vibrio caribbeanicus TaxID=701175 RepID=UPI002283432F
MSFGSFVMAGSTDIEQTIVIDILGNVRVLADGELPQLGEVVVEQSLNTDLEILAQFKRVDGENQQTNITPDIEQAVANSDIDQILAAIEQGVDPTQLDDEFATAAGTTSGSSITSSNTIDRDANEKLADTKFETQNFEVFSGSPDSQSLAILERFLALRTPISSNSSPEGEDIQVAVNEDQPLSGRIIATDIDNDTLTYALGEVSQNGTVTVDENGVWSYQPTPNFFGNDSFTVTVSDGEGGTKEIIISITVNSINDLASISGDSSVELTEITGIGQTTATGQLFSTDIDNADNQFTAEEQVGEYGKLVIDNSGSWTYTLTAELKDGEEQQESFTVSSIDGTTQVITLSLKGTNDAAVISGSSTSTILETNDGSETQSV